MFKKLFISITSFLTLIPRSVFAQPTNPLSDFLQQAGGQAYYGGQPPAGGPPHPAVIIGGVIQQILLIAGVILFMILIYAGIIWMTGGGSEERVQKAQSILTNSFWGMLVTAGAYVLAHYLTKAIFTAVTGTAI